MRVRTVYFIVVDEAKISTLTELDEEYAKLYNVQVGASKDT